MAGFESLAYCTGATKYRNDASRSIAAGPRRRSLRETAPPPPTARSQERARRNDRRARTVKTGLIAVGVAGALRPGTPHAAWTCRAPSSLMRGRRAISGDYEDSRVCFFPRSPVARRRRTRDRRPPLCKLPGRRGGPPLLPSGPDAVERSRCAGPDRQRHVSMTRAAFGPAGAEFGSTEPLTPHLARPGATGRDRARPGVAPVRA
jgi:hypothetical protein